MSDPYDMIDRFLRNNLHDDDYAEYSEALDSLCRAQPAQAVPVLAESELRSILQGTNHMVKNAMHGAFWPELEEACRAVEAAVRAKMGAAVPYDQTALELCSVCGWKTLIPNDGCLNCERQTNAEQPEPQLKRIHPLDIPLEVFLEDLPTRPRNIIKAEMVYFTHSGDEYIKPPFTVRHLLMFSRSEMRKWPNLGKKSLNEIGELLRNRGLQLWEQHDERSLKFLRDHPTYWIAPPPGIVGKEGA